MAPDGVLDNMSELSQLLRPGKPGSCLRLDHWYS